MTKAEWKIAEEKVAGTFADTVAILNAEREIIIDFGLEMPRYKTQLDPVTGRLMEYAPVVEVQQRIRLCPSVAKFLFLKLQKAIGIYERDHGEIKLEVIVGLPK